MSRTRNTITICLATVFVVAAVVAPTAIARVDISAASPAAPSASSDERTATELGQAVGELGDGVGTFARTPTELGQSTNLATAPAPTGESDGFDWGPVAIVGGGALGLALIGLGSIAVARRRGTIRKARAPVVSG